MQIFDCLKLADELMLNAEVDKEKTLAIVYLDETTEFFYKDLHEVLDSYQIAYQEYDMYSFTRQQIFEFITKSNDNVKCGGIYITGIPEYLKKFKAEIYTMVTPMKDVSAMNVINVGMLNYNRLFMANPLISALNCIVKNYEIPLKEKTVTVLCDDVQNSKFFTDYFLSKSCNVFSFQSSFHKIKEYTRMSDVVLTAANKPNFITSDMIKDDSFLFDFGYSKYEDVIYTDVMECKNCRFMNDRTLNRLILTYIAYNFTLLTNIYNK